MNFTPEQYEKLGQFYLGSGYDGDAKKPIEEDLVLYPSKDLLTHGVVLGMTGSGKTGLCIALLEEAAMDGVPSLMIDPKGDITNFLLTFPDLKPEDFRPWIDEDEAKRKGKTPEEYAQGQSELWKNGLASWGQGADRIAALREKVDIRIYTPGSDAGIPLSILSSLNAPSESILSDQELLNDRVANTVSSILGLLNIRDTGSDTPQSVLLSHIFLYCWQNKNNVDMQTLIRLVLRPPFDKLGQLNVDEVLPKADRDKLAKALNNLIASPSFSSWLTGVPLDVQSLLYSPSGKPQAAILSIAHLSDDERMFFVTLLLSELTTWMRAQSGTTSLRALFYMDEIFGYLPPIANPPSKRPMLLLLKQARAFGLGLLLATQNPIDLDYKALSNIGTWWLGRLQTQRDKDRVLAGLEGAAAQQNSVFDRKRVDKLLSELTNRVFLMNNVHADAPKLMHVRWVMSYLCGPLTREQVRILMDPVRKEVMKQAVQASDLVGAEMIVPRPVIPQGIPEQFHPLAHAKNEGTTYQPYLLRVADFVASSTKANIRETRSLALLTPFTMRSGEPEWEATSPLEVELNTLSDIPEDSIPFGEVPKTLTRNYLSGVRNDFINEIYTKQSVDILYNADLKTYSNPGEEEAAFRERLKPLLEKQKEDEIHKLDAQYRDWEAKWNIAYEKAKEDKKRRFKTWAFKLFRPIATISTVALPIVFKALVQKKVDAKEVASLSKNRSIASAGRQIATNKMSDGRGKSVDILEAERKSYLDKLEQDKAALETKYGVDRLRIDTEKIQPLKKDINIRQVGLVWVAV